MTFRTAYSRKAQAACSTQSMSRTEWKLLPSRPGGAGATAGVRSSARGSTTKADGIGPALEARLFLGTRQEGHWRGYLCIPSLGVARLHLPPQRSSAIIKLRLSHPFEIYMNKYCGVKGKSQFLLE